MVTDSTNYDGFPSRVPPTAIAVIGMSCKFPGADCVEEYWQLLESGVARSFKPPTERFPTRDHKRSTEKSVFFGNFLRDVSSFDNRFFKTSSRQAASMDPQQRLLLEVAYQALESSGFFRPQQYEQDLEVGCFIGACASDYNDNVASHPPNAFSTLGTLRAFLSGRISHFFGFSGPSITYDTACSSSAVAIDAACKAIIHGDCTSAIAGGVSIFSSPHFYQNLAQATFLSPTGLTKPFDESSDGYCRAEGVGLVVLKHLSKAIDDGDNILGTILSTAVRQSSNKVPIAVPHSRSQADLYRKMLKVANVRPEEVSYLEAHGSGTPVGDPCEVEAIRDVFYSPQRQTPLYLASVKGNIGHCESASGVAGLIKTLLMLQRRIIPRQVSFQRINPKIELDPAQCLIPTDKMPWAAETLIACVNNYGAAGSIAAMLVKEAGMLVPASIPVKPLSQYPVFISANSPHSLAANCQKLRQHITACSCLSLADIAFNLSEKQNRALPNVLVTTVSNLSQLQEQLHITASKPDSQNHQAYSDPRPVVLAFGGQVNRFVGLSQNAYGGSALLRKHLDECDEIVKGFGHPGIYPHIFSTVPIEDVITLQTIQFALHYACARSWIACGLRVNCIVGHSFGQLPALTISGVLSLEDGLLLAYGRAVLIEHKWGAEPGSMIALDTDRETTLGLIESLTKTDENCALEIACYNGPRSHVLVGSVAEIDSVVKALMAWRTAKYKVLDISHGFHSRFCDDIMPDLEDLAKTLKFHEPKIPLELTSLSESVPNAQVIADATRVPVHFESAVKRIEKRYGPCAWVEAGSRTSITNIARHGVSEAGKHMFCPVDLTSDESLSNLADLTIKLWKNGHHVQFWPFHRLNRGSYRPFNSPPYQFEKTKHWLDFCLEPPADPRSSPTSQSVHRASEPVLIAFSAFQSTSHGQVIFTIDPRSIEWQTLVEGHAVLQQPLCPVSLYLELVYQASREVAAAKNISSYSYAGVEDLVFVSSLGNSLDKVIRLVLKQVDQTGRMWEFAFECRLRDDVDHEKYCTHATGKLEIFTEKGKSSVVELDRVGRLLKYQRLDEIASKSDGETVRGAIIYSIFSRVVNYHDFYKGLRQVSGHQGTFVAQISLPASQPSGIHNLLSNPVAVDNFFQAAGLYTNCLLPCPVDEVYVCSQVDSVHLSPDFGQMPGLWKVCATSSRISDRELQIDIFGLDPRTDAVVFVAFGARFNRLRVLSLTNLLTRANDAPASTTTVTGTMSNPPDAPATHLVLQPTPSAAPPVRAYPGVQAIAKQSLQLEDEVRKVLSRVTDVPTENFEGDVTLADLGIDSLMATEVMSEVQTQFHIDIPQDRQSELQTFSLLCHYITYQYRHGRQLTSGSQDQVSMPTAVSALVLNAIGSGGDDELQQYRYITSRLASLLESHLGHPASDFVRATNLAEKGLDSLLCMELLMSDIEKEFGVSVNLDQLTTCSTYGEVADLLLNTVARVASVSNVPSTQVPTPALTPTIKGRGSVNPSSKINTSLVFDVSFPNAPRIFETVKSEFDELAEAHQFAGFYERVFKAESQLVLAYTVEAFADLGIQLTNLETGAEIPDLRMSAKHSRLRETLFDILQEGQLVDWDGRKYVRSEIPVGTITSTTLFRAIVRDFPQFVTDHNLLHLCGSELATLVMGMKDPISHLFGSGKNRSILEDFYSKSPSYVTMSRLLTSFLEKTLGTASPGNPDHKFRIIEIGAGTGATTKWVLDGLLGLGISIEYTFTDISATLVAAGKRRFSSYSCIKYAVINVENEPPAELQGHFDIVLSTNCLHATRNLSNSLKNINKLLQPHGFVSVVEFTKRLSWFDIVFGLLDGWWMYDDGRRYVLSCPEFWDARMRESGFQHVSWTGGSSRESDLVRLITGFKQPVDEPHLYRNIPQETTGSVETIVFKYTDKNLPLRADVYCPPPSLVAGHNAWSVGLMIHGGGHVMLSRKDVRPRQTQLLLNHGVLPVSVDYRLCPETTLLDGPLVDVSDAYAWARKTLPALKLRNSSITIDSRHVVIIGWSTGGTLAMSLGFTSVPGGLPSPDGILAFYCPTNYEDEFWQKPNFPNNSELHSFDSMDILESVHPAPITAYNPPRKLMPVGGWMAPQDARSRLILHMNWHGQTVPVLFNGLPSSDTVAESERSKFMAMEQPSQEDIIKGSPHAQIVRGKYKSPTWIISGTRDDLVPWQQAQETVDALREAGIESGITLVPGQPHLFDMCHDHDGMLWEAVLEGYRFLLGRIGKQLH